MVVLELTDVGLNRVFLDRLTLTIVAESAVPVADYGARMRIADRPSVSRDRFPNPATFLRLDAAEGGRSVYGGFRLNLTRIFSAEVRATVVKAWRRLPGSCE